MNRDGKADLLHAHHTPDEMLTKKIESEYFHINLEAAQSCPVNIIHIIQNGDKII